MGIEVIQRHRHQDDHQCETYEKQRAYGEDRAEHALGDGYPDDLIDLPRGLPHEHPGHGEDDDEVPQRGDHGIRA